MSKHTNKVHGKLNFLIVAVVLVMGAVAYLFVQSDVIDFNPSDLSSSGNKAIKGAKKAVKYDNSSVVVVDLDGEEVQQLLNSQDFQKMVENPEFAKAMEFAKNPEFAKAMEFAMSPEFAKAMEFAKGPEFAKAMEFAKNPEFAKAMEFAKNPEFAKAMAFAKNPEFA